MAASIILVAGQYVGLDVYLWWKADMPPPLVCRQLLTDCAAQAGMALLLPSRPAIVLNVAGLAKDLSIPIPDFL